MVSKRTSVLLLFGAFFLTVPVPFFFGVGLSFLPAPLTLFIGLGLFMLSLPPVLVASLMFFVVLRFLVNRLANDNKLVDRRSLAIVIGGIGLITFLPIYGGFGHESAKSGLHSLYTLMFNRELRAYWLGFW